MDNDAVHSILFAVEYAPHMPACLKHAVGMAHRFNACIHYLHVCEEVPVDFQETYAPEKEDYDPILDRSYETALAEELRTLKSFVEAYTPEHLRDVKHDFAIRFGQPDRQIGAYSEEVHADVIIISSLTNDPGNLTFSRTAKHLIEKSKKPVLLLPDLSDKFEIDAIFYLLKFQFRDIRAINILLHYAKAFDADLHAIADIQAQENPACADNIAALEHVYRACSPDIKKKFSVQSATLEEMVEKIAIAKKSILLAVCFQKPDLWSHLFGNDNLESTILHANIPVLVFPWGE